MDINNLIKFKEKLVSLYVNEFDDNELDENIKSDELKDIKKEIDKIDSLISILKLNDIELMVANLEKLYLILKSGISEEQFEELDIRSELKLYEDYFPLVWVNIKSINRKKEILQEAIWNNKLIAELINDEVEEDD